MGGNINHRGNLTLTAEGFVDDDGKVIQPSQGGHRTRRAMTHEEQQAMEADFAKMKAEFAANGW